MAGIFEGVDDLIDQSLRVMHIGTTAPHYRHKAAALSLKSKPYSFDAHALFAKMVARMHKNWSDAHDLNPRSPSDENWRWEKKLDMSENNRSVEKRCEKEIAAGCGEDWVNQVPTASGLLDGSSAKWQNDGRPQRSDSIGSPETLPEGAPVSPEVLVPHSVAHQKKIGL